MGRLAEHQGLIEAFHRAPSVHEVLECVRKQQTIRAELHRKKPKATPRPVLWILSAGVPRKVIREFALRPMNGAPQGFLTTVPALRLKVVVIPKLERILETLSLRLLGAGRTFLDALQDLRRLPATAQERMQLVPVLVRYRAEFTTMPTSKRKRDADLVAQLDWAYDEMIKQATDQGAEQGLGPLAHLFERRLGRPLFDHDRAALRTRLSTLGPGRLGDVVFDLSLDELSRWLDDPNAR